MPATFKNLAWWRCRWTMPGSSDLCLSDEKRRWRTCCATRGAKTTRVGKSRYSSFTSSYRVLLSDAILARCPLHVCSTIAQF